MLFWLDGRNELWEYVHNSRGRRVRTRTGPGRGRSVLKLDDSFYGFAQKIGFCLIFCSSPGKTWCLLDAAGFAVASMMMFG